ALLVSAVLWALWRGFRYFPLPSGVGVERRLEADSGLAHRPLEAIRDRQMAGDEDTTGQVLWRMHQSQMSQAASNLRLRWPHPGLFKRDPWAMRFALVLAIGISAVFAEGDIAERFKRSIKPNFDSGNASLVAAADAWITPPDYTRHPPVFLTSGGSEGGPLAVRSAKVPKGSKLTAQVTGGEGEAELLIDGEPRKFKRNSDGTAQIIFDLRQPNEIAIRQSGSILARWSIDIIPDQPPSVEFIRDPVKSKRDALRFHIGAKDDYGVTKVIASIQRKDYYAGVLKENKAKTGESAPKSKFKPLEIELPLPGDNARDFVTTVYRDLTAHRWAGLPVDVTLIATDALGQKGRSKTVQTVLPERRFNNPAAQTIVKERKRFVDAPSTYGPRAGVMLDNLSWHYDQFNGDLVTFLGLSIAGRRLMHYDQSENVQTMEKLLWEIALRIEDGRLSLSERAMRKAQDALLDALNQNASDAEIERLLNEYQRTLSDYFDRLAESIKEMDKETSEALGLGMKSQMLRRQDLMRMLKDIRRFVQSGQRQKARDMLAQLQELMENMRIKRFAKQTEATRRAIRTVNDLKRLVKGQQELLDKTYRVARDRNQITVKKQRTIPFQGFVPFRPENDEGWDKHGKQKSGKKSGKTRSLKEEVDQQESLRGQLGDIMRRVSELNVPIPDEMGSAEKLMRQSSKHLKQGDAGKSVTDQGDVIKALQKSLKSTMSNLAKNAGEDPFDMDEDWLQGTQSRNDPFGRPPDGKNRSGSGNAQNLGEDVEIPGIQDIHDAKQIRDELRRRAGEYERPELEREYYRRLLKRF
ncbi:MAG TPA: TIGR02302 family protein, partial [Rhodospirillaceae bacterium]|nr:TIGR02302 family protein [Rhodospirillaceae bacterium]